MSKDKRKKRKIKITATLEPVEVNGKIYYVTANLLNSTNPCVGINDGYLPDGTHCVAGQVAPDLATLKLAGFKIRKIIV